MKSKLQTTSLKPKIVLIFMTVFAIAGVIYLLGANAATGTANFTLTPASGNLELNKPATFSIYENPNNSTDAIGAFDLRIAYDTTKLTFVSIDSTNGSFTDCFEKSGSANNGKAGLVCSKLGGSFTGNQKIGEVIFTPKVGSGTTAISIDSGSHIYKADGVPTDVWSGVLTNYTYTLTAPQANLKVTSLTLSDDSPQPGQTITFTATVVNTGTAPIPAGSNLVTSFSIDGGTANNVPTPTPLAVGGSIAVSFSWSATAGAHSITAKADASGVITEVSEVDNTATKSFNVLKSGDANSDGLVNSADLAIFSFNYGKTGTTYAQGDFTGDGIVNSADVAVLSFNWGK